MIPTEYDSRGNPRHIVVVEEPTEPAPIIEMPDYSTLPVRQERTRAEISGTYSDRANGFNRITLNLSLIVGLGFLTMATVLSGNSITFAVMTGAFFFGFLVTWLVAYILHVAISPEGNDLYETWRMWNFLDREQKERHNRMRGK